MTRRRVVFGTVAATALFLLLGRWLTALYTDYLWYDSLQAAEVWRTRVATTLALSAASFAVAAVFAWYAANTPEKLPRKPLPSAK